MISPASSSNSGDYVKVPNYPGLYRNTRTLRYLAVRKVKGRRRERSLGTADRKVAERRMADWIRNLASVDVEAERTTLRKLLGMFTALNKGKSKSTRDIEQALIDSFKRWWPYGLDIKVRDIRPSQLEEWLALHERRLKNASYNRYAGFVKQLFDIAVKDRIIVESPFKGVKTPWKKPQTPVRRVPTLEQFQAIVDTIRSQSLNRYANASADFVEFLGLAGLGQAEASTLKWGDIDWEQNRISIRRHKTDRRFYIPIYHHLRPFLERLKAAAGKKATPGASVLKIKDAKKALTAACAKLKYHRFSQRNIRQCLIRRLWQSGVDRKLIAKWQGHSDGGQLILDTYTEVFGDDQANYEQQQLAKIMTTVAEQGASSIPEAQPQPSQGIPAPTPVSKLEGTGSKSFLVDNPFKPDDTVLTQIKGADVTVTVRQVWGREVQVKTGEGQLLWRTMHTVWFPGSKPIPKPDEVVPSVVPTLPAKGNGNGNGTTPASPVQHIPPTTGTSSDAEAIQKRQLAKKRRARRLSKKKEEGAK